MTLLITIFAAVFCTVCWYKNAPNNKLMWHVPSLMFWGAGIMWFVDECFAFREAGEAYFTPAPLEMLNDTFLGFSVVALGLIIWVVTLLIKDPKGVLKK